MKIWLITIGEPIPHLDNKLRLNRTGILAKHISETSAHKVTWWTSDFNHFEKTHIYNRDIEVAVNSNLKMIVLHGCGYSKNVSFARIKDHRQIAEKFIIQSELKPVPDIIVCAFPTLGLCQAAISYGRENNIPVLVDYRDMWPEVFVDLIPTKFQIFGRIILRRLFNQTKKVFNEATGILGITDEFLNIALDKIGRPRGRFDGVFPLGYLENQFTLEQLNIARVFWQSLLANKNRKRVVFFGTLGYQFDIETVIDAAKTPYGQKFEFIICGTGDKLGELKELAEHFDNIVFPGYMSAAQIKALMDISDFGLCPYVPKKAFLNSIPGKAIEYFSAGLPILTTLGAGILGQFVKENGIGINYAANNPDSFLSALKIISDLKDNNIKPKILNLYTQYFSAEVVYSNYLSHIESVVSPTKY